MSELSIEQIIEKDLKANYAGTDFNMEKAAEMLELYIDEGAAFKRVGNTLFIVFDYEGESVKYHTINADPLQTFLGNCIVFFAYLYKLGKKEAITYFNGEKTKRLVEKYKLANQQLTQVNDPNEGEFMLVTDLRGGA